MANRTSLVSSRIDWQNEIVPRVKEILESRRQQGVPTATLRGIFYILVSEGFIENLPQPYKSLSEALVTARRKGIIPYEWITDESREIIDVNDVYITPEKRIQNTIESLLEFADTCTNYIPRWRNQPEYVEVWVEKNAMAGVMSAILSESRQVRVVPNGGWSSETFHHSNFERLGQMKYQFDPEEREKYPDDVSKWNVITRKVTVLYYGDYDPTGSKMVKNIQRDVEAVGATFERVAITKEQIAQFNLERLKEEMTDEVKAKLRRDPNSTSFMKDNDNELFQIELDALNALAPQDFITLLEESVDRHFDEAIYYRVLGEEKYAPETINGQLRKYIKNFDKLQREFRKRKEQEQDKK